MHKLWISHMFLAFLTQLHALGHRLLLLFVLMVFVLTGGELSPSKVHIRVNINNITVHFLSFSILCMFIFLTYMCEKLWYISFETYFWEFSVSLYLIVYITISCFTFQYNDTLHSQKYSYIFIFFFFLAKSMN